MSDATSSATRSLNDATSSATRSLSDAASQASRTLNDAASQLESTAAGDETLEKALPVIAAVAVVGLAGYYLYRNRPWEKKKE